MKKVFLLMLLFVSFAVFAQEKKVALVIGNGKYSGGYFQPLRTPEKDVEAVNWSLQKLGYTTICGINLERNKMSEILKQFNEEASGADVAIFYYSGHGGYSGENEKQRYFLVPSGEYVNSSTLSGECYDFEDVEKAVLGTGARLKLFFIDACRIPLDGSKGWVDFEPSQVINKKNMASGTAWFFGTNKTSKAFEGAGKYSVFTQALLNHIGDSGCFDEVWENITNEVVGQRDKQRPERRLSDDFKNFKDFKLNPMNVRVANEIKEGYETVRIKSTPSNAEIFVDGKKYGNDISLSLPFNKKVDVEIRAEGYESYKNSISVVCSPFSQTLYEYSLSKLEPATLIVSSNVSDAMVKVDGKHVFAVNELFPTYSGTHSLEVSKKGYHREMVTLKLKEGRNNEYIPLTKDYPWFIEVPNVWGDRGVLTYHYSPKYQIGFRYMQGLSDSDGKFSIGAMLGFSADFFSQIKTWGDNSSYSVTGLDIEINNNITIGGKPEENPLESHKEYIDLSDYDYSDYVDPYNEAKHYEVNTLMLAQAGFSPINGFMVDLGLGAAYHRDKYWMKIPYRIKKTWTTNKLTGEVSEPTYEYEKHGSTKMYKNDGEWSLALRLGASLMIPVSDDGRIVVGGGYTHLPHNKDFSSWDACLGYCWDF